jgi:hypothetical protein
MICSNDVTPYSRAADVRANHVIDIDATTFYECLAWPPPTQRGSRINHR